MNAKGPLSTANSLLSRSFCFSASSADISSGGTIVDCEIDLDLKLPPISVSPLIFGFNEVSNELAVTAEFDLDRSPNVSPSKDFAVGEFGEAAVKRPRSSTLGGEVVALSALSGGFSCKRHKISN